MASVTGTFSGTGESASIAGTKVSIKLDFSGTASVDIEELNQNGSGWIKIETGITADARRVYDSPTLATLRLNCTAYTNSVVYSMETN